MLNQRLIYTIIPLAVVLIIPFVLLLLREYNILLHIRFA